MEKAKITPITKQEIDEVIAKQANTVFDENVQWLLDIPEAREAYEKRKEAMDKIIASIRALARELAAEIVSTKFEKEETETQEHDEAKTQAQRKASKRKKGKKEAKGELQ